MLKESECSVREEPKDEERDAVEREESLTRMVRRRTQGQALCPSIPRDKLIRQQDSTARKRFRLRKKQ